MLKTKGFIEPKGSKRDFEGVKEWVQGWAEGKTKGFIEPKRLQGGRADGMGLGMGGGMGLGMGGGTGLRVGFININDMYNNDVGKGVVYAYEAYEAK